MRWSVVLWLFIVASACGEPSVEPAEEPAVEPAAKSTAEPTFEPAASSAAAFKLYEARKWSKAFKSLLPFAQSGHGRAMLVVGELTLRGHGTYQNESKGLEWLEKAATEGHGRNAYFTAGEFYAHSNRDWTRAAPYIVAAAELGNPEAQAMLAQMYASGRGVPRDLAESEKWVKLAAEHSEDRWVAYQAARSHLDGSTANHAKGLELLRSAADKGLGLAQDDLGLMYMEGTLVPRNLREAERWLTEAMAVGVPTSYLHLGKLYLQLGQPKNAIRCYVGAWKAGRARENQQVIKQAMKALGVAGIIGHLDAESKIVAEGDRSPIGACKDDPIEVFTILIDSYIEDARRR